MTVQSNRSELLNGLITIHTDKTGATQKFAVVFKDTSYAISGFVLYAGAASSGSNIYRKTTSQFEWYYNGSKRDDIRLQAIVIGY